MTRGRFITLEGIEGAGKTTATSTVRDWLVAQGCRVRLTREPGGTPLAEAVRGLVLTRGEEQVPPVAELCLMFAARGIHLANLVRPALERGEWVVCDRFTDATRAYQGAGRGVAPDLIEALAAATHADLQPDCTLLLDLPVLTGLQRARGRNAGTDRFEAESVAFFEKVRSGYLDIAAREPARVKLIDASQSPAGVQAQIVAALEVLLRAQRSTHGTRR
jgi:dTMP kinase